MSAATPSLDHLSDLTRRYAEYSRDAAGLATLWGGFLFLFLAGTGLGVGLRGFERLAEAEGCRAGLVQLVRHGYALPRGFQLLLVASPLLWAAGWWLLDARGRRRFGRVAQRLEPAQVRERRVLTFAMMATCLVPEAYFALRPWLWGLSEGPAAFWSSLVLALLGAVLVWLVRREASAEGRSTLLILVVAGTILLHRGVSDVFLVVAAAYLLLAAACIVRGILRWTQYRQVVRELDALGGGHGQA